MQVYLCFLGIPSWHAFKALFDLVEHDLSSGNKLSKLNVLMIFFMKICLNLCVDDIVHRFNVSKSTAFRHFYHVLDVMYVKTKASFTGLIVRFYE